MINDWWLMVNREIIEISYSVTQLLSYSVTQLFNHSPFKIGKEAFLWKGRLFFYLFLVTKLLSQQKNKDVSKVLFTAKNEQRALRISVSISTLCVLCGKTLAPLRLINIDFWDTWNRESWMEIHWWKKNLISIYHVLKICPAQKKNVSLKKSLPLPTQNHIEISENNQKNRTMAHTNLFKIISNQMNHTGLTIIKKSCYNWKNISNKYFLQLRMKILKKYTDEKRIYTNCFIVKKLKKMVYFCGVIKKDKMTC